MHSDIKLLADKNIYLLNHCIPRAVHLTIFDPEQGLPESTSEYDALFVRTVTQINSETLPDSGKIKLVASSSAGIDHIDLDYLNSLGIAFAHAPGNNARSVAEYVCTALFLWAAEHGRNLSELSIGVIGAGHTGRSLTRLFKKLGLNFLCYDPPRSIRERNFRSCSKEELLSADILTFHVPLTRHGKYATFNWLNRDVLEKRNYDLIINTSRGGVVDEIALLNFKKEGHVRDFVLDVWVNEPDFCEESADQAFIATPHIA
ncbi:MAG: NAD(P)-dependent oxidoreductase, partial [Balneolaceae bacterium]